MTLAMQDPRSARRAATAVVAVAATAITAAAARTRRRPPTAVGPTPLGALTRGVAAGVVGTVAFDVWLYLQYRRERGTEPLPDWEFSADVTGWDDAPAPAQVGRRIIEGLFQTRLPDERAASLNNIAHWAYALSGATAYGLLAGSLKHPRAAYGLLLGAGMWLSGYVILPPLGLYKRITEYDAKTLGKDLAAHLVYGTTTATVFAGLVRRRG
ncbi:hypothetical protein P5G50_05125 [Leifsonia sp. F6_8S_P_1B]|uniref:DUF1440 domain-containing protein n=1 Tax=Leifsonia williamsii TaxID=3035919 RepID=A0ABT8KBV7_9MICO|nr:hypothetical protein [Leifsonia williamsii]MDN4613829.1 hypothetical protein [Leifsonia williamsii]